MKQTRALLKDISVSTLHGSEDIQMSLDGKVLYIESLNQGMLFGRVNGRWECVGSACGKWDGRSAEDMKKWLDENNYVWRWVM